MRAPVAFVLLIALLGLTGCVISGSSQAPPSRWTTGFWFWDGSSVDVTWSGATLDVLFVQVGTIRKEDPRLYLGRAGDPWHVYGQLPEELPSAREYWAVFRHERQALPELHVASMLAGETVRIQAEARNRQLNMVGVQLDIDCPTAALSRYAAFLKELRKSLPPGVQISITALLDWFRSGTAIDDVIAQVDEFVPQFYDLGDPRGPDGDAAIAARIDAARWGPVFQRFGKRYRIGISSFGRARMVSGVARPRTGYLGLSAYGDVKPLDVAANPAFNLQTERNAANEAVLTYRAARKTAISYNRFEPGDGIQFILPTPEAIRAAVQSARQMKGSIAGVVFFRWPASNESLALQPDEVLDAAGFRAADRRVKDRVHVVEGQCAAVRCVDIYLESVGPLSPRPARYRIRASTPLEYFLPEQNVPVRMAGAARLELSLPPYCARGRLYLGRAVSLQPADFQVEEAQ